MAILRPTETTRGSQWSWRVSEESPDPTGAQLWSGPKGGEELPILSPPPGHMQTRTTSVGVRKPCAPGQSCAPVRLGGRGKIHKLNYPQIFFNAHWFCSQTLMDKKAPPVF